MNTVDEVLDVLNQHEGHERFYKGILFSLVNEASVREGPDKAYLMIGKATYHIGLELYEQLPELCTVQQTRALFRAKRISRL